MPVQIEEKIDALTHLYVLRDLSEDQLTGIARQMEVYEVAEGEKIISEGEFGMTFFLILHGEASVWRMEDGEKVELARLEDGDYFGEEEMLFNQPRVASITATKDSTLLYLEEDDFRILLESYPKVHNDLIVFAKTHQKARELKFDWLGRREVVYLISRRHPARFWIDLIKPTLVLIPAALFFSFAFYAPTPASFLFGAVAGGILILLAVLWGVWEYIDWQNDYFIVTNQRVVWLERILLQSASRQEAPMATIQSVNVQTDLIGRALDYGDVVVRTFTGSLVMSDIPNPKRMQVLIEELLLRLRSKKKQAQLVAIRESIRSGLGFEQAEITEDAPEPVELIEVPKEIGLRIRLLETRVVEGNTFTYHRHWYALFRRVWLWLALMIGGVGAAGWLLAQSMNAASAVTLSTRTSVLIGLAAVLIPAVFGVYEFMDWRNDIYKVTKDSIIDSEKKPFGTQITKSAPLKNVLSLENYREGILGILLNYGSVRINVGDTTLEFNGVHNPPQVQQDIFYQMQKLKLDEEEKENESEQARMVQWLRAYHEMQDGEGEGSPETDTEGVQ